MSKSKENNDSVSTNTILNPAVVHNAPTDLYSQTVVLSDDTTTSNMIENASDLDKVPIIVTPPNVPNTKQDLEDCESCAGVDEETPDGDKLPFKAAKSFKEIALLKNLEVPNEETGLVFNKSVARISQAPVLQLSELYPDEKELALINKGAVLAQKADKWIVLRNVNPLGIAEEPDSDSDVFSNSAQEDMKSQAKSTPLLEAHCHDREGPPAGMCIAAKMTAKGLRETIAIPIEKYNEEIIRGILNGTYCHLSVGVLVFPENKICTACEKSIYSYSCPHEPGQIDPMTGKRIVVRLDRVERYLERSLVHVPARLNTSIKSVAQPTADEVDARFAALRADTDLTHAEEAITNNSPLELFGAEVGVNTFDGESIVEALGGVSLEKSHLDTIETVKTIEDSIVADKAQEETKEVNAKAADLEAKNIMGETGDADPAKYNPKAVEEDGCVKSEEKAAPADPEDADDDEKAVAAKAAEKAMEDEKAAETKAAEEKAVEDKSKEMDYSKSFASLEMSTKSLSDVVSKVSAHEATVKSLIEANKAQGETITKLLEASTVANKHMEAQNDRIEKLLDLQEQLAKSVSEALQVSSQETLEALSDLVNSAVELTADNKSASLDVKKNSDWTKQLLSFGQTTNK